jgi:hypothetical protein
MENNQDRFRQDTRPIRRIQPEESPPAEAVTPQEEAPALEETPTPPPVERPAPPETSPTITAGVGLSQDDIPTPVPMPISAPMVDLAPQPAPSRTPRLLWLVAVLSLLISIVSLSLNGLLIYRFMGVQRTAIDGVDAALGALDNLTEKGFEYEYRFNKTIPFSGDIPIKQDLVFPFKGNIPINTTVRVPIDAGVLGTFTIDVPINTVFPVDLEVPISVDQTIHVETEIPLDLTIPIELQPGDPLIQELLGPIQEWLLQLRDSL